MSHYIYNDTTAMTFNTRLNRETTVDVLELKRWREIIHKQKKYVTAHCFDSEGITIILH